MAKSRTCSKSKRGVTKYRVVARRQHRMCSAPSLLFRYLPCRSPTRNVGTGMNLCWAVYAGLRDTRPMLDGEINEFYARGYEHGRLFVDGRARLEFVRTMELLERLLPASPARVLDIGGGTGVYARAWPWITSDLLCDIDDDVARTAWRAAVIVVPELEKEELIDVLVTQLGRGDREVQLSLSRALVDLGEVVVPALEAVALRRDPAAGAHARATTLLLQHPGTGFDEAIEEAQRAIALGQENPSGQPC